MVGLGRRCLLEHARQLALLPRRAGPPGGARQGHKSFLGRIGAGGLPMVLVQPAKRLAAVMLELARELVADRPRRLDLAPHAGRDLRPRRETLLQPLGRHASGDGRAGELLEQRQGIAPANEGEVGHNVDGMQQLRGPIVPAVDSAVKTLYSASLSSETRRQPFNLFINANQDSS